MGVVLFGASWMRQTKEARDILDDGKVEYNYVDVEEATHITKCLNTIVGDYKLPILFHDGKPHVSLEGVREYLRNN